MLFLDGMLYTQFGFPSFRYVGVVKNPLQVVDTKYVFQEETLW